MYLKIIFLLFLWVGGNGCSKPQNNSQNTPEVPPPSSPSNPDQEGDDDIPDNYSTDYEWGNLKIGGGGYVTGIVIHPLDKSIMYIRTDVGGAYRWDPADKKWVQMLEWIGPNDANLIGVDGIAIDPNNMNRVYLALGKDIGGNGGIYRSEDRGQTWTKLMSASYAGNGRVDRWTGECIAVDPNNSNIIYVGTRQDGLWRSTDDGNNWARVGDVPYGFIGEDPTGIRSIVFDPKVKIKGQSSVLYIGVPATGVYKSTDGGESFGLMSGSPDYPSRMQVVNEELFVTHATGVVHWEDGQWSDITPPTGKGMNYVGLAIDANDQNKIVVAQRYSSFYNPFYRSDNKGADWQEIRTTKYPVNLHVDVPWWDKKRFSSATASIAFVPGSSNEIYYTDWFGVWYTPDIWSSQTDWYTMENGHEETVIVTLVSPPSGAMIYSGMADNFGFRHQSLNSYPPKKLYNLNEGFSIAVSEKNPSNIAILGATGWDGANTRLSVSSDFGENWADRTLPSGSTLGRISISSADPNNLVYIAGGGQVYYSLNGGVNWQPSQGAPSNSVKKTDIWNKQFVLTADLENENFYLYDNGQFFVSTNKGKSWGVINSGSTLPTVTSVVCLAPVPGRANEVWISLETKGLYKSGDAGKTFQKVTGIDNAYAFSWGAAPEKDGFPTAYCYGTGSGGWGLYRSVDKGKTWKKLNDDKQQFMATAKLIAADRNQFGQVYIGTGGYGIIYGKIK